MPETLHFPHNGYEEYFTYDNDNLFQYRNSLNVDMWFANNKLIKAQNPKKEQSHIRNKKALINYLITLKQEGFNRIHVSNLIPQQKYTKQKWTQFPHINESLLNDIHYNQLSGWFTLNTTFTLSFNFQ